jgi:LysR family transcriptional regulator, hydrogen peroxide-inducible genes activator
MELQQLRYVIAVADAGNFTRAAEKSFVTQPSLSQQILNLEAELGHKLFHRLGRKAVPTEAGQAFLDQARRILLDVENATRQIRDDPSFGRRIVVGAIPTLAPYLLPVVLERCRKELPNLDVHLREDFRAPLCKAVTDGELDLALVSLPVKEPQLSVEPLFSEPLLLVVAREHPLSRKAEIVGTDLAEETFVLLGHSSTLASQIQRFCGEHNFEPKIAYRCTQIKTVKSLVELGLGISILPQVAKSREDTGLTYRRLSGRAPIREIAVVRHLQRYQSRGAESFLALMKDALSSYRTATPWPAREAGSE